MSDSVCAPLPLARIVDRPVSAALESDLNTLTMRELASLLEVSHSALYRWVGDRDELFDLICKVMIERILPTTTPTADGWRDWLARLAWAGPGRTRSQLRAEPVPWPRSPCPRR